MSRQRRQARDKVQKKEALVAHRELQVIRSGSKKRAASDAKYMKQRQNKLKEAVQECARAHRHLQTVLERTWLKSFS